ncbi:hypothetical protein CGERO_03415 [Corynebacterium gerontici]|uniref:Uncharacterized protein n=1 Tax=Corynebacterium gerontici TaxID=2079234 RepID=A0A3G6IZ69_9CORY|nr:hypothetical protein CGERO_03415 [Corynebacterium gerontici]
MGWLGLDSVEVILLVLAAIALLTSLRLARVVLSALGGVVLLDAMSEGLDQALGLWFVELPFAAFCLWYAQRLHAQLNT